MYLSKDKKAQSILEYVILICVVLSALLIMSSYVKRAYSGRIKTDSDSISPRQYAPRHTTSQIITTTTTSNESCSGTECQGVDVPYGVTAEWTETDTSFDQKEAVDSFAATAPAP
jgi:hypothetical protein